MRKLNKRRARKLAIANAEAHAFAVTVEFDIEEGPTLFARCDDRFWLSVHGYANVAETGVLCADLWDDSVKLAQVTGIPCTPYAVDTVTRWLKRWRKSVTLADGLGLIPYGSWMEKAPSLAKAYRGRRP
ncbi:MAG: hypothetical protein Q4A01_04260 [Coriobacteriales bacterium]|nr:hypothetical protein [Coriobacteriales bacterium]